MVLRPVSFSTVLPHCCSLLPCTAMKQLTHPMLTDLLLKPPLLTGHRYRSGLKINRQKGQTIAKCRELCSVPAELGVAVQGSEQGWQRDQWQISDISDTSVCSAPSDGPRSTHRTRCQWPLSTLHWGLCQNRNGALWGLQWRRYGRKDSI